MSDSDDNAPDLSKVNWDDNEIRAPIKSGAIEKVDLVSDLVKSITTKKNIGGLKKQLKTVKKKKYKTLDAPAHRQAQIRIQSAIANKEVKKDLRVWNEVIKENRAAEQIVYPLNHEDVESLHVDRAADKAQGFKPRTEFEKKMAELLGKSKNNLKNDDEYTEAEKEILKAMSLKESREKTAQLRRLRFLTAQREAKFHRQKKIKSKTYHKIKKRQKRREAIKDFEELLAKDPEAAQEKLNKLDNDRVYERAALRHRGQNKWSKELRQYASRNPEVQKILADHLKFHRELKKKHGDDAFSTSDEEDDDIPKLTVEEVMKLAADQASKEVNDKEIDSVEKNPWLKNMIAELRSEKAAANKSAIISDDFELVPFEKVERKNKEVTNNEVSNEEEDEVEDENESSLEEEEETSNTKQQRNDEEDIDTDLESDEETTEDEEEESEEEEQEKNRNQKKTVRFDEQLIVKSEKKSEKKVKPKQQNVKNFNKPDIDLKTFLEVNNVVANELPEDVNEAMDDDDETERDNILAEAFADDDVIDEFEEKKKRIEEDENPIEEEEDIRKLGWGSWTGPGIAQSKAKKRKVSQRPARKDGKRAHVIIRENLKNSIEDHQPSYVPFPFKRPEDFEALIQQPIGKDWNLVKNTSMMTKPEVVAPSGRIIRPMDRSLLKMETAAEQKEEEDDEPLVL